MFRKRNPTLLDRMPTGEIADGAAALRERAHDAADAARDAISPRAKAAKKAAKKVAKETVAPRVDQVRDAVAPRVETMWDTIAPTVGSVATAAVDAIEAAKQRAEDTAKSTTPTRKEARRRGKLAAAALRGERPPRRWPSIFGSLGLGAVLGAAAGILGRRMTSPAQQSHDFSDPAARHSTTAPVSAAQPVATPAPADTAPVTRNEENVIDLSVASDEKASTAAESPPTSDAKPSPSQRPRPAKKAPPATE